MPVVKHSPTEILDKLQIVDLLLAEGRPLAEALRSIGVTEAVYRRWRVDYDGLLRTLGPLMRGDAKRHNRRRARSPKGSA